MRLPGLSILDIGPSREMKKIQGGAVKVRCDVRCAMCDIFSYIKKGRLAMAD